MVLLSPRMRALAPDRWLRATARRDRWWRAPWRSMNSMPRHRGFKARAIICTWSATLMAPHSHCTSDRSGFRWRACRFYLAWSISDGLKPRVAPESPSVPPTDLYPPMWAALGGLSAVATGC